MANSPDPTGGPGDGDRRQITQAADKLHRRTFGTPVHMAGQIRSLLPPELVARMRLTKLTLVEGTYIDDDLTRHQSDVLMRTHLDDRDAYIYLLEEQQSSDDPLMAWRMLKYMVRIWERHMNQHPTAKRLPPIVPIVLYHGDRAWSAPVELHDLFDLDPDLADTLNGHLPRLRFLLDDLTQIDDDTIRARPTTPEAMFTLVLLRDARNNAELHQLLWAWRDIIAVLAERPDGSDMLRTAMTYIRAVGTTPDEELRSVTHRLGPQAEEAYMTTADMLRAEARTEVLTELLTDKFGPLPETARERLAGATVEQLKTWTHRILHATTLDEALS